MKINRIKNTARSLSWGVLNKILLLLTTFFTRTIIIYKLGTDYLGLESLFSSILSVLNLAELGFGSAMIFSMYKPIATDDKDSICALMNYYRKTYRIIGIVILAIGILIMPFIRHMISGKLPDEINIYWIYLITLSGTAATYFIYAYKNCLLMAYQRNDVSSKIGAALCIPQNIIQIILILVYKNYYMYLVMVPIFSVITNLVISMNVKKIFPQYIAKGALKLEVKSDINIKIKGLFIYKIGNVVSGSADNIVIAAFLGLSVLGMYNNYFYIINMLFGFFIIYFNAISAGIGNSIATECIEKNYEDFKKMLFLQGWIVGWCSICLICLFQHFMYLWVGPNLMFPNTVVLCFVIYFYVWKIQDIVNIIKEAAGMWNQDKWRPMVSAGTNLLLNLILVRFWGVYGIILSTVFASLFVGLPWASRVLFKNYYKRSSKIYYLLLLKYTTVSLLIGTLTYYICNLLAPTGVSNFIIKIVICGIIPNSCFYLIYKKNREFISITKTLKNRIQKLINAKKCE